MFRWLALSVFASLYLSCAASAQGIRQVQTRGPAVACLPDYMRLCRGVLPGGGRILYCLNAQADQLSQECFQSLARKGLEFAAALKACRPDVERFCPNLPAGLGRGVACLAQNAASLSQPCREALRQQDLLDEGLDSRRGLR